MALFIQQAVAQMVEPLTLLDAKQIKAKGEFELSGLALHHSLGVLAVEDESNILYKIDTLQWRAKKVLRMKEIKDSDMEGVEVWGNNVWVVDERRNVVWIWDTKSRPQELDIDYATYELTHGFEFNRHKWGNAGYEGLAVDSIDNILYLAKERTAGDLNDGRYIVEVHLKPTPAVHRIIEVATDEKNPDFADLRFERRNGQRYLYALERNTHNVCRINLATGELLRYSFAAVSTDDKGMQNLYDSRSPQFGLGEALLMFETEIWIGYDNNQRKIITSHPIAQKYGLSGSAPVIFRFLRPVDF